MIVLGIHGGYKREDEDEPRGFALHDSAAAVVSEDGVLAAIEEERLSRLKHANTFPTRAIRQCLSICGIAPSEINVVAVNVGAETIRLGERMSFLQDPALPRAARDANIVASLLRQTLGGSVAHKLKFCDHHLAHAWSAFVPSGLDRSLIVSLDGDGDGASGRVFVGTRRNDWTCLRTLSLTQSLGHLYQNLIAVLGYSRFDEYKVMALASCGDPQRFASLFSRCYRLLPKGDYALAPFAEWFAALDSAGLVRRARRVDEPFTRTHKDFAAALQAAIEQIVLHMLRHFRRVTGERNLCLAGGVAHNCALNGAIVYSSIFDQVYVQPAAHDAGGALGAAWAALGHRRAVRNRRAMRHAYLGSDIGTERQVLSVLQSWSNYLSVDTSDDIARDAAKLLARGAVIGWAQGRAEFGPRALGNRSILADPRPAANQSRINEMVKRREHYRPFAPAILEERLHDYYIVPEGYRDFPYMTVVLKVRNDRRRELGAVTHIDGSARVQTVSSETNPLFWRLVHEFGELTGTPVLLNTSFNNHAEPIVDSVADAVGCFLTTALDYLVVDRYVVAKRAAPMTAALCQLAPRVPLWRKLVLRGSAQERHKRHSEFSIESTRSRYFGSVSVPITSAVFDILSLADGDTALADIVRLTRHEEQLEAVVRDLHELWVNRVIVFAPSRSSESHMTRGEGRARIAGGYNNDQNGQ